MERRFFLSGDTLMKKMLFAALILAALPANAQDDGPAPAAAPDSPAQEKADAGSNPYGGAIFSPEVIGVSAGFHRWLGKAGVQHIDMIGANMAVAVDDPWLKNHFYFGAVFSTAVGEYGDPDAATLYAAALSTTEYIDEDRSVGGTTALPPLSFSYSTIAARATYRLRTEWWVSGEAYTDLGYGLLGTEDAAQMNGYLALGVNAILKIFPSLIMTLGLQYRQDIPFGERIEGFENMSALAVFNSFELVKF
jgi:hypothetical protein